MVRRPLERNAFEIPWAANGSASERQRTPDEVPTNPSDFRPRSPPLPVAYNYDRVSITLHAHPLAFAGATAGSRPGPRNGDYRWTSAVTSYMNVGDGRFAQLFRNYGGGSLQGGKIVAPAGTSNSFLLLSTS